MKKKIISFLKVGNVSLIIAFFVSNIAAKNAEVGHPARINDAFITEFELKHVMAKIDRTTTRQGYKRQAVMLITPTTNRKLLEERKELIKKLAKYEKITAQLRDKTKIIAQNEESMLRYFNKNDLFFSYINNNFYQTMYVLRDFFNFSSKTMQGYYTYKVFWSISTLMLAFGLKGMDREILNFLRCMFRLDFSDFNPKNGSTFFSRLKDSVWSSHIRRHRWKKERDFSEEDTFFDVVKDEHSMYDIYHYLVDVDGWYRIFAFSTAISGTLLNDFRAGKWMWDSIPGVKNAIIPMQELQVHLVSFASLMNAIKEILKIQVQNKLFSDLLPNIKPILQDKKIREIFTLLGTDTFKKEYAFLFNHGRVLYVHKLITENFDKIVKLFLYIGELDCYLSLATLYHEMKDQDHTYSFAEYLDDGQGAILDCDNAWVPLFGEKSAIQNIKLGVSGIAQNMVITGPNMSGKSIYLKMVGINALLAQTITLVPAKSCKITLFDSIYTCLDPVADISRGLSKFASQKLHLEKILQEIELCKQKRKPGLFLIDEILSGTVESEIARRTRIFGNKIADNLYSITLITTHVEEPVMLEQDTKGHFKNFHIEIIPLEDGTFQRTFTIKSGYAPWWFSNIGLRILYTDWIELPRNESEEH